ncbi:MAG: phage tail sheath family protein [Acidimicrobiales bacterium]
MSPFPAPPSGAGSAPGLAVETDRPGNDAGTVRLDVAAFAGVAPRGPARQPVVDQRWGDDRAIVEPDRPYRRTVPVPVGSWAEYLTHFGGRDTPGRLGQSVAAFFDQGGRRAWILRIVHDHGPGGPTRPEGNGAATGRLDTPTTDGRPVDFHARNEGRWGNDLRLRVRHRTRPIPVLAVGPDGLRTDIDAWIPIGSLLRAATPAGHRTLHWVRDSRAGMDPSGGSARLVDTVPPVPPGLAGCEVVEADVEIVDLDPTVDRTEHHTGLGLSAEHPRWLARELSIASPLVLPGAGWAADGRLAVTDPRLPAPTEVTFSGGEDRTHLVVPEDFLDPTWWPGLPDDDGPGPSGVAAVTRLSDVSLLVTPDLYDPVGLRPPRPVDPDPSPPAQFEPCRRVTATPSGPDGPPASRSASLAGLGLDPRNRLDRERIGTVQQAVVAVAASTGRMVALLDVPPGLPHREVLRWRQQFTTSFAAAYHPWLWVPDRTGRGLRPLNPSAVAAGIVAGREQRRGIPVGPANEPALGVVGTTIPVSDAEHDRLHPAGINVFRRERDGVRLLGARTLSRTTDLEQLSVRRLLIMIALTVERQLQWTVFEPNDHRLRDRVAGIVTGLLRQLFDAGAFSGATEQRSFFVRVDDELNPSRVVDQGRLVVEIGLAVATPVEMIVVRLSRQGDGTLTVDQVPARSLEVPR